MKDSLCLKKILLSAIKESNHNLVFQKHVPRSVVEPPTIRSPVLRSSNWAVTPSSNFFRSLSEDMKLRLNLLTRLILMNLDYRRHVLQDNLTKHDLFHCLEEKLIEKWSFVRMMALFFSSACREVSDVEQKTGTNQ